MSRLYYEYMTQFSIKHRPRKFDDIFGQDAIVATLKKSFKQKKAPKAMLLKGQYGTGKTTTAHIIAMTLQCQHLTESGDPCLECSSCQSILSERFDRDTMMLDGSQMGGKDSVIDFTSVISIQPMYDKNRVLIIEEADQLSNSAVNALLKILESPQEKVFFILLSMTTGGVPPAIQSRCQTYFFKPVPIKDTMFALKSILEKEGIWDDPSIPQEFKIHGLGAIAGASKGSLREAMQLLERCLAGSYYTTEQIREQLGVVDEYSAYGILKGVLNRSSDEGLWKSIVDATPAELYGFMMGVIGDSIVYKLSGYIKNEIYAQNTKELANAQGLEALFAILSGPAFQKQFIRSADIISAISKFYIENPIAATNGPPVRVRRINS